ncbi:unnamed protein product [Rhizophagus irregularis]|nr:unnamed protein product [Rhizophagus irregularis]
MSDNDFDDADYDEYESSSDIEYNQDAPQDPVISEEEENNSEKENLPQTHRISPAWKYFNDKTSQYPGRPVCCKCQKVFGKDTGISTLKRHLSSAHKIMIENVKSTLTNQSVLNFKRVDPWPEKEKSERDNAVDTLILLEPLEKATVLLSASSYPTISDIRFLFLGIQQHLDDYIGEEGFSQSEVASSILEKIKQYWEVVDSSTIVATILDPRTKLTLFATGEESTNAVNAIKSHFAKYNVSPLLTSLPNTNQETVSNREYFHQLKRRRLAISDSQTERSVRRSRSSGIYEELDRYLASPCDDNVEPLLWWEAHFREFPALGAMARDYLSIQATSVPCEQAFSVASNTITRTRNRMLPETARALLCSKSWLEKGIGSSRKGKNNF